MRRIMWKVLVRRIAVAALGVVGTVSLVYVVLERSFLHPEEDLGLSLAWPLLGVLPLFVLGVWLLAVSRSRVAVYVAVAGSAMAVSLVYETVLPLHPQLMDQPWFPWLNAVALTVGGVALSAFMALIATFPDGRLRSRWQRIAVRSVWVCSFAGVLTLLTEPLVVLPAGLEVDANIPNPVAVPALEWLAPVVDAVAVTAWVPTLVTAAVFARRAFGRDPETPRAVRPIGITLLLVAAAWGGLVVLSRLSVDALLLGLVLGAVNLGALLALPVVLIQGVLRHDAFDVAVDDRAQLVVRSSSTIVTFLYGIAVAAPAVLLLDRIEPAGAVLLTTIAAVALLPLRGWLMGAIRRAVLGDRERHLELLAELGVRLEQAPGLDEVLSALADGVRGGLDASWVRVGIEAPEGGGTGSPLTAVSGAPTGPPVVTRDLVHGEDVVGRIELGSRRRGEYPVSELALLDTVARQATSTVAAVGLTTRLEEGLEELRASRARLVSVQDAERRRIERDLHDGVQASIVALIANLALARQRLHRGQLAEAELVEVQDQAREVLVDLRELARGIHPQVLTDRGLVAAVESRTARFPLPVRVVAEPEARDTRLDPDTEAVAFYVVSEALANTAKHAEADGAVVRVALAGGTLEVEVRDHGTGFEPPTHPTSGGLANMRDRVTALGGRFVVESAVGRGSAVRVELPAPTRPEGGAEEEPAVEAPVDVARAASVRDPEPAGA